MENIEFINALQIHVRDAAILDTISELKAPVGRRVSGAARLRSDWYKDLKEEDSKIVNEIIALAVHGALFGVLASIDGARKIVEEDGDFRLFFEEQKLSELHHLLECAVPQ
jgi:hypothetical protein